MGRVVAKSSRPPAAAVPERDVLYYSHLGPDTIDVSRYPSKQQYQYQVFSRVCSQCHTLARAINAPKVGRSYWEFYLARMRLYSRFARQPVSAQEKDAILDFLDYDTRERKVKRSAQFEALTRELKKRYDALVEKRLRGFQTQPQPQILRP